MFNVKVFLLILIFLFPGIGNIYSQNVNIFGNVKCINYNESFTFLLKSQENNECTYHKVDRYMNDFLNGVIIEIHCFNSNKRLLPLNMSK